jgi:hypothetical protein
MGNKRTTARRKAFEEVLKPAGFISGEHLYVRKVGRQIQGIDYQTARFASEYTLNLGVHFDFVPTFFKAKAGDIVEYDLLDFLLMGRPSMITTGRDDWRPLSDDMEGLRNGFVDDYRKSLEILDECARGWADPAAWLALMPPEIFEIEESDEPEFILAPKSTPPRPVYLALPGWFPDEFKLCLALTMIAGESGDMTLARRYAQIGMRHDAHDFERKLLRKYWRSVAKEKL